PGILTLQRVAKALRLPASALYRLYAVADPAPQRHARMSYVSLHDVRDVLMLAADVTVPDHTVVMPGERFTKTWAIQNVGQVPWPERQLVRID
ncbi:hypothetical protein LW974_17840, partial [Erwinia amylovora]|uniref:NBR1-Ig-like domain-containing protein n=1 Tax=Erwinia amylovora TaxID=552 RepID=UPI0020C15C1B